MKKFLLRLICLSLMIALSSAASIYADSALSDFSTRSTSSGQTISATSEILGDIDGDGYVNLTDLILALQITAGFHPSILVKISADVNNDGKIGLVEALFILRKLVELPPKTISPEIVQLIPTGTDSLSLAWLAASKPSATQFVYEVHISTSNNFTPSLSTLKKEVGELQAEIAGLDPKIKYYVLVLARDPNGDVIPGSEYWDVTTNEQPMEFNPDYPLQNTHDLGLGVPVVNGDVFTFQNTGTAIPPEEGSYLIGEDLEGGFLRFVDNITLTQNDIIVKTYDCVLQDAVRAGRISSSVRLFSALSSPSKLISSIGKNYNFIKSTKSDGSPYARIEWKDKFLTAEEEISPKFITSTREGYRSIKLLETKDSAGLSNEITLEANIDFEPKLKTDVAWHSELLKPVIDSGEIIAIGSFRANFNARYQFSASYDWGTAEEPNTETLWTRKWVSVWSIGSVLVFQENILTLTSEAWASASAEVDTTADSHAETVINIGVRYNPATEKWEPVNDLNFSKGLTVSLNAAGTVTGEVRLVPNLEIKFYKVLAADLSIEPYTNGLIKYTLESFPLNTEINQFKNFDFILGLDCNANLTFSPFFGDFRLYEGQLYKSTWPLFDLPQLSISAYRDGSTYHLNANITDGTNNKFINDSIKWEIVDPDGIRAELQNGLFRGSTTASFTPEKEGKYMILLSGYGLLGEWIGEVARQYTAIELGLTIIYVDSSATGQNDGSAPEDAFVSLEDAFEFAGQSESPQIEIIIAPGTYTLLKGETVQDEWLLSGNNKDTVFVTGVGIYNRGSVVNITFTNCTGDFGGGIDNDGMVGNCTFSNCVATYGGGGILNWGSVDDCTFNNCSTGEGGGIYNLGLVDNCTFNYCSANNHGGGIYNARVEINTTTISNCVFTNCSAEGTGGGVENDGGTISDCVFTNCSAELTGGGVFNSSTTGIVNCTFSSCSAVSGGGICNQHSVISNCTFSNCSATFVGGGIENWDSVNNCTFSNCSAMIGGGIANGGGSVNSCTFNNCSADAGGGIENGGGITNNGSVDSCTFNNCSATGIGGDDYGGGGVWNAYGQALSNCTFIDCSTGGDGGGIYYDEIHTTPCTINGNDNCICSDCPGVSGCSFSECIPNGVNWPCTLGYSCGN